MNTERLRKKKNSARINLTISVVVHTVLIFGIGYFAAREGILGKKLQQLAVTMVKEKKPEPPKEKAPEPKVEVAKPAEAPKTSIPQPKVETAAAPPPAAVGGPVAAPAAVSVPAFEFSDGAKAVTTLSDPNAIYKALIEHALLSRWTRPEGIADENYAAEAEVSVDAKGRVENYRWVSGSGDKKWDASVKAALETVKVINKPPPKGFPQKFTVRFDVESQRTEEVLQISGL